MGSLAVTVKNDSSRDLSIDGDPNWDDQVLTIDGEPRESPYNLRPRSSAVVGIAADYNEMGVIFGSGDGQYQLSIGPDPETGNQGVTDEMTHGSPAATYTLSDAAPLTLTMRFADADAG